MLYYGPSSWGDGRQRFRMAPAIMVMALQTLV